MDAVILPPSETSERRFPWWILLAVGVIVVAAGAGLLVWPFIAASWILVILFGAALIANGLALIVRGTPASVGAGLLLAVAGVLAIVFSEFTANALVTFFGIALIILGAFWLVLAFSLGRGGSAVVALPAVLVLLAGVVALVWPAVALAIVAVIAGLCTLALGASLIWGALGLRRMRVSTTAFRLR